MVKALITLFFVILPQLGFAQAEEGRDLVVFEESATGVTTEQALELKLPYNGKAVEESGLHLPVEKNEILAELLKEMLQRKDQRTEVVIPNGPESFEELEIFKNLSAAEMKTFLRKKQTFLRRFAKALQFVKLKPAWINKALAEVNAKFFRSSRLIANSNTVGGTVMLSAGAGLALPSKIVERLKTRPIGQFIPDSGGFYYMLGLGAGLVRFSDPETKKSSLHFELFVDAERLKKTLTGLLEATAAGTMGVVYEHREKDFWSQKVDVVYGGAAGLFRSGQNHFGWAASLGVSAPPFIGAVLVYNNDGVRRYLMRLNITKVFVEIPVRIFQRIAGPFRTGLRSCSRVY